MIVHPILLQCQSGGSFGLTVSVVETSSPAASDYALGENIYYDIILTATGSEVYNLVVEDRLSEDVWTTSSLTGSTTYSSNGHTVTETDILNGYVSATIDVTYEDLDGNQYSTSAVLTIQNIEAPNAELTVTLSADKASYTIGETIIGSATVQNTGNLTISAIQCAAFADSFTISSSLPGQSNTFGGLSYPASTEGTQTFTSTTTGTPPTGTTLSVNEGSVSVSVQYVLSYKVNTEATTSGAKRAAIPFNLYNVNSAKTMTVDWGDGTTSALKAADYTSTNGASSIHTYTNAGVYTIRITYDGDWTSTTLGWYATSTDLTTTYNSRNEFIAVFIQTLIEVLTPLPPIGVIRYYSTASPTGSPSTKSNAVSHMFRYCKKLTTIPANLFILNGGVTAAEYTFNNCQALAAVPAGLLDPLTLVTSMANMFTSCKLVTTIPSGFLDKNTAVTSINNLFYGWEALTAIPAHLLDKLVSLSTATNLFYGCQLVTTIPTDFLKFNTALTNVGYMFYNCYAITAIPVDLFRYNTRITNFQYAFRSCNALTTLPTDIFKYNTAVTNFKNVFYFCTNLGNFTIHIGATGVTSGNAANFVSKKTGATRTVYVPSSSTTQTTFNSVASSLGLTVVGE